MQPEGLVVEILTVRDLDYQFLVAGEWQGIGAAANMIAGLTDGYPVATVAQIAGSGQSGQTRTDHKNVGTVRTRHARNVRYVVTKSCRAGSASRLIGPGQTGKVRAFVCPYHHWRYDLDGTLRNAPQIHTVAGEAFSAPACVVAVPAWTPRRDRLRAGTLDPTSKPS